MHFYRNYRENFVVLHNRLQAYNIFDICTHFRSQYAIYCFMYINKKAAVVKTAVFYALLNVSFSLSAIMAINSELVGLPR